MSPLLSISFLIDLRSGSVTVAARIRAFFLTVIMRGIVIVIADPAATPQSIQDQTSRPNS